MNLTPPALAAVLALTTMPLAAQEETGNVAMTDITCEAFLDLPAADQEMHATALTTARMDAAASSAEAGDQDTEADTAEDEEPSQGIAMPVDGIASNILSPTVVALVTICENSVGESDKGTGGDGNSD